MSLKFCKFNTFAFLRQSLISSPVRPLLRYVLFAAITAVFVWGGVFFVERPLLNQLVVPQSGTRLTFWIADFMNAASLGLWGSVAGSFGWFAFAQWISKVLDWRSSGKRIIWGALGALTVGICTAWGFYYVPIAESGGPVAYSFFFLNSALIYYMSTALASPPSHKYSPYGAKAIRVF